MTYNKKSLDEKKEELKQITEMIRDKVKQYYEKPENIVDFVTFSRKFYHYSFNNRQLIQSQMPASGFVASYTDWKKKGYSVNKGEKGLKIFQPVTKQVFQRSNKNWYSIYEATKHEKKMIKDKKIPLKNEYAGSKIGHVFDISQTNVPIKDYPTIIKRLVISDTDRTYQKYIDGAKEYAKNKTVKVTDEKVEGIANGFYSPSTHNITMSNQLDSQNYFSTLIHELAHSQLHQKKTTLTTEEKEVQAETTASVVLQFYGIEATEGSLSYIKDYGSKLTEEKQYDLMKDTIETAVDITQGIDDYLISLKKNKEIDTEKRNSEKLSDFKNEKDSKTAQYQPER